MATLEQIEFVRNYILNKNFDSFTANFLAYIPAAYLNDALARLPDFTDDEKKQIKDIAKTRREELKKTTANLTSIATKYFKSGLPAAHYTGLFTDKERFVELYRNVEAIWREVQHDPVAFPDQPRSDADSSPVENPESAGGSSGTKIGVFGDNGVLESVPSFPSNITQRARQSIIEPFEGLVGQVPPVELIEKIEASIHYHGLKLYEGGKVLQWSSPRALKLAEFEYLLDFKDFSAEYKEVSKDPAYKRDYLDDMLDNLKSEIDKDVERPEGYEFPTFFRREYNSLQMSGNFSREYTEERSSPDFHRLPIDDELDNHKIVALSTRKYNKELQYIQKYHTFSEDYILERTTEGYITDTTDKLIDEAYKSLTGKDPSEIFGKKKSPEEGDKEVRGDVRKSIQIGMFKPRTHYTTETAESWKSKDAVDFRSEEYSRIADLFKKSYITKLDLSADRWVIKNIRCDVLGITNFLADNSLEQTNVKDCCLGAIIAYYVETGAIPHNDNTDLRTNLERRQGTFVKEESLENWKKAARTLVKVAFYYESQGATADGVRWFESFKAVYGDFITETNFMHVMKMLINSKAMKIFTQVTTLREIQADNNVLRYRLTRLSTPSLVHSALSTIKNTTAAGYINLSAAMEYCRFAQAGVIAQIASGPLKRYCTGNIDPLDAASISDRARICDLKPIEAPPFDAKLIKQTAAICDVYEIPTGRWYQASKAKSYMDLSDAFFEKAVKGVKRQLEEQANEEVEKISVKAKEAKLFESDEGVVDALTELLNQWR